MAAEQQIRSFVKRLLSSGSLHGGKHSPRRKARDHSNCNCSELAESTPLSSCPEHPSRGQFRNLGGPEYSRLSADALKELETDVEQGVGYEISSRNLRVASGHPPAATSTSASSQTVTSCVSIPSKNMDITRSPSQGFSTGIIPLTTSAPAAVFLPGYPSHVPLPRIKTCGSPASSATVSNGNPRCHYSHFRRKPAFANGSERRTVVAKASGRVAEAERDSPQVAKDKETLERLAASEEAGPSGRDSEAEEETEAGADFITVTTFNILAPIYKRVSVEGDRESADEARWKKRNEDIVKLLLAKGSSIICLQEFWHKNEELCELYRSRLGAAGYTMFQMGRTNDKGDGLFTAISSNHLRVLDMREIVFHDCGDRVAQLFHLQATELLRKCSIDDHEARPFDWCGSDHAAELILVNTHLMFPHNGNACVIRLRQVYKLVDYLGRYQRERNLPPMPIILCGDWNGSKHGQVYKFLRSRGCISTYDAVHHYDDSDSSRWVSHQNHRGNLAGVDFIYLLNPSNQCEKLEADWKYGAFAMIRSKLREAGLHDRDAFQFFLKDGTHDDHITMQEFYSALDDLGLTGNEDNYGLTPEEIEEIARGLDRDGDGVISFEEASARVNEIEAVMEASMTIDGDTSLMMEINSPRGPPEETTLPPEGLEFVVRDASFERSDFEQGKWPSDYTLSDHAPLTAIFEPVMRVP